MEKKLIEFKNIVKEFDGKLVLKGVSLDIYENEFVTLLGPSGCGKTTLLRILNGSLRCDGGAILVNGVHFESADRRTRRAIQTTIGTIYQDFCLVENSTCLANVLTACLPDMGFFPAVFGIYGKKRRAEALKFLDRVGLLEKSEEPVKNLSGGQKQRAAIARALMRHPKILLADEPAASLDPVTGRQILTLLKEIQEKDGVTILMNSHNLEFSQEFSDRIIGLKDGNVVFDGKPGEMNENILRTIYHE